MKKILIVIAIISGVGCTQRGCQSMNRNFQTSEREYDITVFSGGDTIFHDRFKGIINQEEHSDGLFYFKGDTLIELGGQYVIKSDK